MEVSRNFRRNKNAALLIGVALTVLALLIGIGIYCQQKILEVSEATSKRGSVRQLNFDVEELFSLVLDLETSQRGYLLTGRQEYLNVYDRAKPILTTKLDSLELALIPYPEQKDRFERLRTLISQKEAETLRTIQLVKGGKSKQAIDLVNTDRGKAIMDEVRGVINGMVTENKKLIAQRSIDVAGVVQETRTVVSFSSVVAVLLVSVSTLLFALSQGRKRKAEELLQETNAELEHQAVELGKVIALQNAVVEADFVPDRVMKIIIEKTQDLTRADGCVVEIVDGDETVYRYTSSSAEKFLGTRIKMSGSLAGACVLEQRALICSDTELDERVNREACRRVNIRSMIVVPLRYKTQVIGIIKAYSAEVNFFSEQHRRNLELVAGMLASTFGQASEFEEKQKLIFALQQVQIELTHARDEANRSTKIKSEFLANMSHEIRTPLNGILGMTGMLIDSSLAPDQLDYAKIIERSGQSLLALLNDILDFSKIEAGKLDFEEIDFDIVSTMLDLKRNFQFMAKKKGLGLVLDLDDAIPHLVKGDPGRLRQVIMNLVGNSLKFTNQGTITLGVKLVEEAESSMRLHFAVRDTGIGIKPETLKLLFQAFVQADSSTTRQYGGTGLGLSISQRLVERMEGNISVSSVLGEGSVFEFSITLKKASEKSLAPELTPNITFEANKYRVLVVEDNQVNQQIALKMMEKMGFRADIAGNGEEALKALEERPYDIVLMDCQMPVMDGYEATMRIRQCKDAAKRNIPILAMTANAIKGDDLRCKAAGMDDYITKPISVKKLAAVMHKWISAVEEQKAS